jgi:O-acetyl-ADP-ribose deacetylase (regulator of RNase III)
MTRNSDRTSTRVTFVVGDITTQEVDAIVNAANSSLLGGGGVDGAIHRAGGPSILAECRALRSTTYANGLPAGDAAATTAGDLPARRVIHTVGPIWRGGKADEAATLQRAYTSCLGIATAENIKSIAFPSISTGAYGYPVRGAAREALTAVAQFMQQTTVGQKPTSIEEIRFVLHTKADYDIYIDEWSQITRAYVARAGEDGRSEAPRE